MEGASERTAAAGVGLLFVQKFDHDISSAKPMSLDRNEGQQHPLCQPSLICYLSISAFGAFQVFIFSRSGW
jgi:hypothetical protein